MTRAQAAVLPLSLSAHAAGLAGILVLSVLRTPLPAPTDRLVPPPLLVPVIAMPRLREPVRIPSRPARASVAPPRAALPNPAPPPLVAPTVIPPVVPFPDDDMLSESPISHGGGCLGCDVGKVTGSTGDGPGNGSGEVDGPPGGLMLRIGGLIREPRKLRHVAPGYPEIARAARIEGTVVVECTLTPEGQVAGARVVTGHPLLAPSALRAVQQWLYQPTLLNGVPVPVIMTVTVRFDLR